MKTAFIVMLVLLLVSVAGNVYQWDIARTQQTARLNDNLTFQRTIEAKRAEIAQKDSLLATIEHERQYDSLKARAAQIAQNREIQTYKNRLAKIRPGIEPVLDSIPDLREFVALQDKIITGQDSVIATQERQYLNETGQLNDIIAIQRFQIADHVKINEATQGEIYALQARLKKSERQKGWLKVGLGAALGAVIFVLATK